MRYQSPHMSDGQTTRCRSRSPRDPSIQCEKAKSHNTTEAEVTHQQGFLVWKNGSAAEFGTALHQAMESTFHSMCIEPCGPTCNVPHGAETELRDWWIERSQAEMDMVIPKSVQYGATDLIDIGRMLARTMGREVGDAEAAEMGIFFYALGKLSRWQSAIERGDLVSLDTLVDLGAYTRMAQRVRMDGGWPGTKKEIK